MVKGNSIFALTGLAVAVAKYESSLSSDTEGVPEVSESRRVPSLVEYREVI